MNGEGEGPGRANVASPFQIYLFAGGTIVFWTSLYVYIPIFPSFARGLGASLGMVGLIVAVYGLSQLLLRLPLGMASDLWGRRRPFIIFGFAASAVSAYGLSAAADPWALFWFRALAGVAASTWVLFTVLFAQYVREDRTGWAMGVMVFCINVGQLVGSFAGGLIAETHGLREPFRWSAILGLAGGVLALFFYEPRAGGTSRQRLQAAEMWTVMRNKGLLWVAGLAALGQYITWVTVYGFTPLYADEMLGAGSAQLGYLTVVSLVPNALAALASGGQRLARFRRRRVAAWGFLIMAVTTAVTPLIPTLGLLYVNQALAGVGRGLTYPVLMDLSIRYVPSRLRATAMGVFQAVYALGMFLGPAVSGALGQAAGMSAIFYVGGLIALGAYVMTLRLDVERSASPEVTAPR